MKSQITICSFRIIIHKLIHEDPIQNDSVLWKKIITQLCTIFIEIGAMHPIAAVIRIDKSKTIRWLISLSRKSVITRTEVSWVNTSAICYQRLQGILNS